MKPSNNTILKLLDRPTILLYLALVVAGWFSICGATYDFDTSALFSMGSRPVMQLIWIATAICINGVLLTIDSNTYEVLAPYLYVGMLLLLAVTIVIAPDIKGSHSWLVLGPLRLQPAEFAKITTSMALASVLAMHEFKLSSIKGYTWIFTIVMLPILLIILQNETGSALVFFALFLALYREGFNGVFLGLATSAVVIFVAAIKLSDSYFWGHTPADVWVVSFLIMLATMVSILIYVRKPGQYFWSITVGTIVLLYVGGIALALNMPFNFAIINYVAIAGLSIWLIYRAWTHLRIGYFFIMLFSIGCLGFFHSVDYVFDEVMQPHQQTRIKVALGVEDDPRGSGYNVEQSKIAIGSGGLTGKGFLKGTQTKLKYVPEQATDFIFCTIGEEKGFVGASLVLIAFAALILRILYLSERQTTVFARVYGYCVGSIFLFHLIVNVGMVLGIVPVIGIPLPFFSYGGSSLWGFSILLFIFLSLDARREA
ncbi:rod shape-determining protein RodA [Porphyromonas crevioricanis]|uniref:Cell wall polymerase n=4 Tax=Porphyromonas crevioricanis TaxID=393921 RepID=A0A0A2FZP8_9PORP|nr:rod shape-determining protein RodA [Porphyromonas crevioricanis]KGN89323.1 rod shape-determining protein RodA [Porphyromonas crevioricanis]KGN93699.1 rod shape-determining protein RodA [Porphyromonas crevioricanis]SKA02288.1 rod shape determining protein RodA [Porphyromonas crevioricanis]SQH73104.1 Rod shape-determining protein RodA [Porphyromonas crevioricanis]GAD07569.1 rod shape-determining protein RodA [Porphyromonas crevioricanis JCM 13913]